MKSRDGFFFPMISIKSDYTPRIRSDKTEERRNGGTEERRNGGTEERMAMNGKTDSTGKRHLFFFHSKE